MKGTNLSLTQDPSSTINSHPQMLISQPQSDNIYIRYHKSEIEHNRTAYRIFCILLIGSFLIIVTGIVACFIHQITTGGLVTISGVVSEFISSVALVFLERSDKNKLAYYKELSMDEELKRIMNEVDQLAGDDKMQILTKIVDNYCSRRCNRENTKKEKRKNGLN